MTGRDPGILVFGGGGQLGRDLSRAAAAAGAPLHALSHASADIADERSVRGALRDIRPAVVVNAAAFTRVDDAEVEVQAAERANAVGPRVLAHACEAAGVPLIHVSTDYVFDGRKAGSYSESDPVSPLGVYGATKAAGEEAIRAATARHVIIRTAWLYGEFGHNFLKTILRLARERDELRVVADQHGCPTSTRDLANAIVRISPRLAAGDAVWGTYHFAGDGVTTWHGFATRAARRLEALAGKSTTVRPIATADHPTKARRPQNSALDCSTFARAFGFKARSWDQEADEIADILIRAGSAR